MQRLLATLILGLSAATPYSHAADYETELAASRATVKKHVATTCAKRTIAPLPTIAPRPCGSRWLNPVPARMWDYTPTITRIRQIFPMFELSIDGLEQAVQHLMAA